MRLIICLVGNIQNQIDNFRAYFDVESPSLGLLVPPECLMLPLLLAEILFVPLDLLGHALVAFALEFFNLLLLLHLIALSLDSALLHHKLFAL